MNFEYLLSDINELSTFIKEQYDQGWIGSINFIKRRYDYIMTSIPYGWYFCKGLERNIIDNNMKDTLMELGALLCNLNTLRGRLESCKKSSTIHINVEFSSIKKIIINSIENSNLSIDIAVAWLTDPDILHSLQQKIKQSVSLRIILNDDEINHSIIKELLKYNIPFKKVSSSGPYNNIMHHKFCIFDNTSIITGSYNWTNKANYNNENIVIIINQLIAKKFLLHFNELWLN